MTGYLAENLGRSYPFKKDKRPVVTSGTFGSNLIPYEVLVAAAIQSPKSLFYEYESPFFLKRIQNTGVNIIFTVGFAGWEESVTVPLTADVFTQHSGTFVTLTIGHIEKISDVIASGENLVVTNGHFFPTVVTVVNNPVRNVFILAEIPAKSVYDIDNLDLNPTDIRQHIHKNEVVHLDTVSSGDLTIKSSTSAISTIDANLDILTIRATQVCNTATISKNSRQPIYTLNGLQAENIRIESEAMPSVSVNGTQFNMVSTGQNAAYPSLCKSTVVVNGLPGGIDPDPLNLDLSSQSSQSSRRTESSASTPSSSSTISSRSSNTSSSSSSTNSSSSSSYVAPNRSYSSQSSSQSTFTLSFSSRSTKSSGSTDSSSSSG